MMTKEITPVAKTASRAEQRKYILLTFSIVALQSISAISSFPSIAATNATSGSSTRSKHLKTDKVRLPIFEKPSNPHSTDLSPDAVQLANTLQLTEKFLKLKQQREQLLEQSSSNGPTRDLRQDLNETRTEILEIIEQTRLEIDFVAAEIEEEQAAIEEVLKWYGNERDERVNNANRWAFRTNGVLWAAAEALAIPTYRRPRLSVPSGTVGIVAGLVPMMFSEAANRSLRGFHHERKAYPNMLCKVYDLPTTPRIEFPESVWTHLNQPPGGSTKSRREMLQEHWVDNQNIHTLSNGVTTEKIKRIAGIDQSDVNIDLLSDRSSMLRELKACVLQMTRPLLELSMCLRDKKQVSGRLIGSTEDPID